MIDSVDFDIDRSSQAEIAACLLACDVDFLPPLSSRVLIADYAAKLCDCSTRFEAWCDGELVGLVAAYLNAADRQTGFITSVCTQKPWINRGIASRLLGMCLAHADNAGFRAVELEVDGRNRSAVHLYLKTGFVALRSNEAATRMRRERPD